MVRLCCYYAAGDASVVSPGCRGRSAGMLLISGRRAWVVVRVERGSGCKMTSWCQVSGQRGMDVSERAESDEV
jgi:hypothetical protein